MRYEILSSEMKESDRCLLLLLLLLFSLFLFLLASQCILVLVVLCFLVLLVNKGTVGGHNHLMVDFRVDGICFRGV